MPAGTQFAQDEAPCRKPATDLVDLLQRSNAGSPEELGVRQAVCVYDRVKDDISVRQGVRTRCNPPSGRPPTFPARQRREIARVNTREHRTARSAGAAN